MWQARQSRVVKGEGFDELSDEEEAVDPIIRAAYLNATGGSDDVNRGWPNNLNQGSARPRLWAARSLSSQMGRACALDLATHGLPALFQTLDISERMFVSVNLIAMIASKLSTSHRVSPIFLSKSWSSSLSF